MILFIVILLTAITTTVSAYAYARYVTPTVVIYPGDLVLLFAGVFITVAGSIHLVTAGPNGVDAILIMIGLATEYGGTKGLLKSIKVAS